MTDWIDAHTHLDSGELYDRKLEVLDRAWNAGVRKLLLINSEATRESFERTLECASLAHSTERFAAFGIHPHQANTFNELTQQALEQMLAGPRVIALGEIGLDFYYNYSSQAEQVETLKKQLRISLHRKLPVVIHCRDAYGLLTEILRSECQAWTGMIHCFTGTPAEAEKLLALGFYISFSGIVTFRNAEILRESARSVPVDRILVETDAPYLAPVPYRGKTNEPAYVVETAKFIGNLKNVTEEQLSSHLFENFNKLFFAP